MGNNLHSLSTLAADALTQAPAQSPYPAMVFAGVLFICIIAVSLMPARRTHLD